MPGLWGQRPPCLSTVRVGAGDKSGGSEGLLQEEGALTSRGVRTAAEGSHREGRGGGTAPSPHVIHEGLNLGRGTCPAQGHPAREWSKPDAVATRPVTTGSCVILALPPGRAPREMPQSTTQSMRGLQTRPSEVESRACHVLAGGGGAPPVCMLLCTSVFPPMKWG